MRHRSRLIPSIQLELLRLFGAGVPARISAELTDVNRNTAILFFHKLRAIITLRLSEEALFSMARSRLTRTIPAGVARGRGAAGKVPVFGLLKRGGKVHAVMIPDAKSLTLVGIIRQRIQPDSIVYTESFGSYDILDVSEFHQHLINHSEKFAVERNHINGIENFWNQAKRHLSGYNSIPKAHFHLFLKECEWRFNHRPASNLLSTLRK